MSWLIYFFVDFYFIRWYIELIVRLDCFEIEIDVLLLEKSNVCMVRVRVMCVWWGLGLRVSGFVSDVDKF